ncbi:MAG: RSP_2648 family PIN domain-containing protein [Paracoccaceae bacterium]
MGSSARTTGAVEPNPTVDANSSQGRELVFLDACVLFPSFTRSLLLSMAVEGIYKPLWSARVLEEWRRAIGRKHGDAAASQAEIAAKRMERAFPNAEVPACPDLEAQIRLPDPADAHVLAAAVEAGADVLLTFNLRDFPARTLAAHGVEARHPDAFLWAAFDAEDARMRALVCGVLTEFDIPPDRARAAFKRARLSRFGKAWVAQR